MFYKQSTLNSPNPPFVFELAVAVAVVHSHIDGLDAIDHPLMKALLTTLLHNDILQHLEVFGNRSTVSLRTTLQLDDSTDCLTTLANHLKGLGDLAYLQHIDSLGNLRGQVGQLEARCTPFLSDIGHQTIIVASVFIIGNHRSTSLEGELTLDNISTDGVQPTECGLYGIRADNRLQKDVAHLDLIASLVDKLDDMVAKL